MTDAIGRLLLRAAGEGAVVRPDLAPRFAPDGPAEVAGETMGAPRAATWAAGTAGTLAAAEPTAGLARPSEAAGRNGTRQSPGVPPIATPSAIGRRPAVVTTEPADIGAEDVSEVSGRRPPQRGPAVRATPAGRALGAASPSAALRAEDPFARRQSAPAAVATAGHRQTASLPDRTHDPVQASALPAPRGDAPQPAAGHAVGRREEPGGSRRSDADGPGRAAAAPPIPVASSPMAATPPTAVPALADARPSLRSEPAPPSFRRADASPAPQLTIGRVELRVAEPPPPALPRRSPHAPPLSLAAWLRRGGDRG